MVLLRVLVGESPFLVKSENHATQSCMFWQRLHACIAKTLPVAKDAVANPSFPNQRLRSSSAEQLHFFCNQA